MHININQIHGQFDRDVLDQLYEQCSPQGQNQVNLHQFIQVILQADQILAKKI